MITTLIKQAPAIIGIVAFIYGTMVGSFLCMAVYRTRKGISTLKPARSFCDYCGATINPLDLVPVLGWLVRRGRTRCCNRPIKPVYPAVEFTTGLAFAVVSTYLVRSFLTS